MSSCHFEVLVYLTRGLCPPDPPSSIRLGLWKIWRFITFAELAFWWVDLFTELTPYIFVWRVDFWWVGFWPVDVAPVLMFDADSDYFVPCPSRFGWKCSSAFASVCQRKEEEAGGRVEWRQSLSSDLLEWYSHHFVTIRWRHRQQQQSSTHRWKKSTPGLG